MTPQDYVRLDGIVPALLEGCRHAEARDVVRDAVRRAISQRAAPRLARNLIVTGPPRVGKSLLAQRIVAQSAAYHVNVDRMRLWYFSDRDEARREASRRAVFEGVLAASPNGIVIDGDDFISANRSKFGGIHPLGLDQLVEWRARGLAGVIVVGSSDVDPESKLDGLQAWRDTGRCWTTQHSVYSDEAKLPKLAAEIVRTSRMLRDLCAADHLMFLSLGSTRFDEIIGSAATLLAAGAIES